jgi:CTD small phosphatase-like protein 2
MAKKFEIIIFTASHKSYADAILDELDPDKNIFSHRLYRNNCTILPN